MTEKTKPKTHHEIAPSVPVAWRQVQEAQKKRDAAQRELNAAIAKYAGAESDLALATDRLDRATTNGTEQPAPVKP